MEIGDKLLVYEIAGFTYVNTPYALLTITQKRTDVPGSYGSSNNVGYLAEDQYGIEFEYAWDMFPDEAMSIAWFSTGKRHGQVLEEPRVWSHFTRAPRRLTQLIERYPDLVVYCSKHKCTYLKELGCGECVALEFNTNRGLSINRKKDVVEY